MPLDPFAIEKARELEALKRSRLSNQFNLQSFDTETFSNSVPENQKPQGQAKLPALFQAQAGKLIKFVTPALTNLLSKFGLESLPSDIKNLSPEELKQKYCPTTAELDLLINERNDIVDYLNNVGTKLDSLSVTVEFGAGFANLLQGIINRLKAGQRLANIAMSFIPLALPGAVPATINTLGSVADSLTFNDDGTPKLPPLTITASQVSPSVSTAQATILKVVEQLKVLDLLVNLCNPNATLTGTSQSIQDTATNELIAQNTDNEATYKGFILEIETKKYTDTVNQNRAVGKNTSGIIMIATEYSFASDPNVLIRELKFIIDRDDLKAY
jgi:hypothetical protein